MRERVPELAHIRRTVAGIFLLGSIGTGFELILLKHVEGFWQNVPLALIGFAAVALAILAVRPAITGLRVFQAAMWLFVVSGVVGVLLHYQGKCRIRAGAESRGRWMEIVLGVTQRRHAFARSRDDDAAWRARTCVYLSASSAKQGRRRAAGPSRSGLVKLSTVKQRHRGRTP